MLSILVIILYFLTIVPLTTILHELGHLFFAQLLAVKKLRLSIGTGPTFIQWIIGDFHVRLNLFFFTGGYTTTDDHEKLENWKRALIAFGGPLLSGIIFLGVISLGFGTGSHLITIWFQWFALYNLWVCLMNLIPFVQKQKQSDGFVIYLVLKEMLINKKFKIFNKKW